MPFLPVIFSAILLAASFSSFNLGFLAWICLVPFFWALEAKPLRFCILAGLLAGIVFWSICLWWLVHVTLLGQAVLILYLAVYFAVFAAAVYFSRLLRAGLKLFFIPCAWVILEYVRSHLFTGLPWSLAAFSQYTNLAVIQIAQVTGAWGVSFLVILINSWLFLTLPTRPKRPGQGARLGVKYSIAVWILFVACFIYGLIKISASHLQCGDEKVKIALVQGNIAQDLKWDKRQVDFIQNRYEELTVQAASSRPQLIVWPEAAVPGLWGRDEEEFIRVFSLVRQLQARLLLGAVSFSGGQYFNSALLVNPQGEPEAIYHKLHLVPFGEYIPFKKTFPFLETIAPIGDITAGKEHTLFELYPAEAERPVPASALYPAEAERPVPASALYPAEAERPLHASARGARFGVLICFEDLFPELSRELVKNGAGLLVNITNDAWYKESSAAYQHLAASVLRSVENQVCLVRAANTGISAFIEPCGRISGTIRDKTGREIFVTGSLSREVCARRTPLRTIYNRWGDFFILLCLLVVAAAGINYFRGKKI